MRLHRPVFGERELLILCLLETDFPVAIFANFVVDSPKSSPSLSGVQQDTQ